MITKKRLRGRAVRRLFRGVYADATLPDTHILRCAALSQHLLPPGGVVAGRSALTVLGPGLADAGDPVEILVPAPGVGPMQGLRVRVGQVPEDEIWRVGMIVVTNPVRTCWDLASWLDVVEAVVLNRSRAQRAARDQVAVVELQCAAHG